MTRYALVTAAYNEERFIVQTMRSIVAQTRPPAKWIIVSDGSTDKTDDLVRGYADAHPFITLCRITEDHPRNFTAQVHAINLGLKRLTDTGYDLIGNLDADITFEDDYFERLLYKFERNPRLGLAGGTICEQCFDGEFRPRKVGSVTSVAHACQLFRRECFESIGSSYLPLPYGGPDTHAEVSARMRQWHVASFTDLKVFHHRPTSSAEGILKGCFRQGKMDYSLGALPLFELFKLLRRVWAKPYVMGSLARAAGFVDSYWRQEARAVTGGFIRYARAEQKERVLNSLGVRSRQARARKLSSSC